MARVAAASSNATAAFHRTTFHKHSWKARNPLGGAQSCSEHAALMKHYTDLAERRSKLISVIRRWIFELLEETVDGGANFGSVCGLGVLAVSDVQRIHRHRRLLCRALVSERNIFRVIGDALQHAQRNG